MSIDQPLILVLDSDAAVRASLKFAFEVEGLTVVGCATSQGLLDHPKLTRAHCVILDSRTVGVQVFELLGKLKSLKLKAAVILALSSGTVARRRRALAAGATYVIEKPFLDSALLEAVTDAIDKFPM